MKTISEIALAISSRPTDMALRLDLADHLQLSRKANIAAWMRGSMARCQAYRAIDCMYPSVWTHGSVDFSSLAPHNDRESQCGDRHWERIRPDYWKIPQHCVFREYYGRWMLSCHALNRPGNRENLDELATMQWLENLSRDGLLELIEFSFGASETCQWALELPESIRNLPFSLNSDRAFGDGFSRELSRNLLSWPSLVGLYFTPAIFPKGIAAELPALAARLRFLVVKPARRSADLDVLFNNVASIANLRLLSIVGMINLSAENIAGLARSRSIAAIGIYSRQLSRSNLFTIGQMPQLRCLGINSSLLRRSDITKFRREFPNIDLRLSRDMQYELGPV